MKEKIYLLPFLLGILLLVGCSSQIEETVTYKINEPIFMPVSQFRSSVKISGPQKSIDKQGKIAFFKGYIYLSEPEKGIHIIDNTNPSNPTLVGFIELLGNVDLAIKDDVLYADSYIDMVWFDISEPANPKLLGREDEVFPTALPETGNIYFYEYSEAMKRENGIVVGWRLTEKTETYMRERGWHPFRSEKFYDANVFTNNGGSIGKTGSMSRFAIYKKYLYTIKNDKLGIFDIEQQKPTKAGADFHLGWNVETIFSYEDNMFIGTPTGMLIYSVQEPLKPEYMSSIQHVYGCDPVVVEDDIAYVTIHSGNNCGQNSNQLIIINVEDVKHPKAIVTYEMTKPKGVGIDGKTLFVCDDGLKVFNATDPLTIMTEQNKLAHFKSMDGYDVIALNNVLMMIAENGIYQYDYSDINNIKQISYIPIQNRNS